MMTGPGLAPLEEGEVVHVRATVLEAGKDTVVLCFDDRSFHESGLTVGFDAEALIRLIVAREAKPLKAGDRVRYISRPNSITQPTVYTVVHVANGNAWISANGSHVVVDVRFMERVPA
jgi:hypothetical protein